MKKNTVNFILLFVLVVSVICQLGYVVTYWVDVPYADQWGMVPFLVRPTVEGLFAHHNGHWLVIPRLVFWLLASITLWNCKAEVMVGWILLQLIIVAFCFVVSGKERWSPVLIVLSLLPLTTVGHYENLLWGWQLQIQLSILFALCTALSFRITTHWLRWVLAIAFGTGATWSFGSGLAVWPAMLPLIWREIHAAGTRRGGEHCRDWRGFLLWFGWAGVLLAAYWATGQITSPGSATNSDHVTAARFAGFVLVYIGNGLWGSLGTFRAGLLGTSLVIAFFALWTAHIIDPKRNPEALSLLLFVVFAAGLTALARSGDGIGLALAPRYKEFAAFVPGLCLALSVPTALMRPRLFPALVWLWGLIVGIGIDKSWKEGLLEGPRWRDAREAERQCLIQYRRSEDACVTDTFSAVQSAGHRINSLRQLGYSVFRDTN